MAGPEDSSNYVFNLEGRPGEVSEDWLEALAGGQYDYIIVGLGTAGATLARYLSDDMQTSVLVLEAGENRTSDFFVQLVEFGVFNLIPLSTDPKYAILRPANSFDAIEGFTIPFTFSQGKGWGGTSMHNQIFAVRGAPAGYDAWASFTGDTQWSYNNLLPVMKFIETYTPNGTVADPAQRGSSGPLFVTQGLKPNLASGSTGAFYDAIANAAGLNIPYVTDFNDPTLGVVGWSAFQNYADPTLTFRSYSMNFLPGSVLNEDGTSVGQRKLTVLSKALVTRVLLNTSSNPIQAYGVECLITQSNNTPAVMQFKARKKIILCPGVVDSPAILQRSGIGPSSLLSSLGIPVVIDNANVGANMQTHYGVVGLIPQPTDPTNQIDTPFNPSFVSSLWFWDGHGPNTSVPVADGVRRIEFFFLGAGLPQTIPPGVPFGGPARADGQPFFTQQANRLFAQNIATIDPTTYVGVMGLVISDTNKLGSVQIASVDPTVSPEINMAYYQDGPSGHDMTMALNVYKGIANLSLTYTASFGPAQMPLYPPATHYQSAEYPGGLADDDSELQKDAYADVGSGGYFTAHSCGTCRMAPSAATGVVDSNLDVFGLIGLAVCDNSVVPEINSGHTAWPAYVLGVKKALIEGVVIPGL